MSLTPEREAAITNTARKLPVAERGFYLDGACVGDVRLRRRVEERLLAHVSDGTLFPLLPATDEGAAAPAPSAAPGVSESPSDRPGDRIGRYKLLQQIGEGGCGVVYMAEQEEPVRRRVAVKIIKLGMDTKNVITRFEAERQAIAMMDHPNIAKVLDAGATVAGRPYFVMELVRGVRITAYCDENQLSTEARLRLFLQVCQAVQHAHQKGVIHRDLKPSNILVSINDGVPMSKVIDFGIAKSTQGRLTDHTLFTAFEQFLGTPAYMSPEQAMMTSLDIDTRTDIYSLGVLLYELLTGRTPFDQKQLLASGVEEMRRTIREQEPPRPSTCLSTLAADALTTTAQHHGSELPKLIHRVRGDLDWIVMKALEKDRNRRYETANALAMDIQRHLGNEPVAARAPGGWYRFQKLARRNKLGFTAIGTIILALVLGVAASSWRYVHEKHARRAADAAKFQVQEALAIVSELRQQAEAGRNIAAVQLTVARRQFNEAEKYLKQVPFLTLRDYIRAQGDSSSVTGMGMLASIGMLGDWHAGQSHWQEALMVYQKMDELRPNDNRYQGWVQFSVACLLLEIGDLEAHRRYCQRAVAQFSASKDPFIDHRIAKIASVVPGSGVDLDKVASMADRAVASTNLALNMPAFEVTKALAEYRCGRFANAVEWSQKRPFEGKDDRDLYAERYLIMAMAQHHLQHPEEARSALAAGSRIVEALACGDKTWQGWISAHVVLREAKALIEGPPATPGKVDSKQP